MAEIYTFKGVYQTPLDGPLVAPSVEDIVEIITTNGPFIALSTDGVTKYTLTFTEVSYNVANWEANWTATGVVEDTDPVDLPVNFILKEVIYTNTGA